METYLTARGAAAAWRMCLAGDDPAGRLEALVELMRMLDTEASQADWAIGDFSARVVSHRRSIVAVHDDGPVAHVRLRRGRARKGEDDVRFVDSRWGRWRRGAESYVLFPERTLIWLAVWSCELRLESRLPDWLKRVSVKAPYSAQRMFTLNVGDITLGVAVHQSDDWSFIVDAAPVVG
jgi:hypothetical protein